MTSIDAETKKPENIHFYHSTKGGVDTVDQLCGNYSVSRRTRRWPLCIFFQVLNIAGVNGHIVYNMTHGSEDAAQNRRQFLKNLHFPGRQFLHLDYKKTETKVTSRIFGAPWQQLVEDIFNFTSL